MIKHTLMLSLLSSCASLTLSLNFPLNLNSKLKIIIRLAFLQRDAKRIDTAARLPILMPIVELALDGFEFELVVKVWCCSESTAESRDWDQKRI